MDKLQKTAVDCNRGLYIHSEYGVDTKRPKTKCPITKHPKHNTQKQNTQDFKMSKVTKCPNVQNYNMFKVTKCQKFSKNVKIINCLITT